MIYTVTLSPAIDCFMDVGHTNVGKVNRAVSQELRIGGKGINVSLALREFGIPSVLMGFVAGFTGDALTMELEKNGLTCDFVRLKDGNTRINVKLSASGDGDPDTEINAPGPVPTEDDILALLEKLSGLENGDVLVLAGSLPAGTSTGLITRIASALPSSVPFVCDLSGEALRRCLDLSPVFVKPNVHELLELFGVEEDKDDPLSQVAKYAEQLAAMGAKNVLVTMGGAGAYYVSADGRCGFLRTPEKPVSASTTPSAVGCGDSAVAGWLIGMGYGCNGSQSPQDPAEAAKFAVALGTSSFYFGFPPTPSGVGHIKSTTDTEDKL